MAGRRVGRLAAKITAALQRQCPGFATANETSCQLQQQRLSRGFFASSCLCIDILGLEEKPLAAVSPYRSHDVL